MIAVERERETIVLFNVFELIDNARGKNLLNAM
jgi:hypothetical protein